MNCKAENGILTVFFSGRIDSTNADSAEKELTDIRQANPHTELIIDADELEYISSAGLRIILRTRKAEQNLKIVNTRSEVYEIFEMTGFTDMINIEKAYKQLSVDGCEIIGKGAKGIVYRYDADTIVKVYINSDCLPDIQNERNLAKKALVLGIPTAISYDIVKVGDKYGSVFELLDANSYSKLIKNEPENIDKYVKEYAELLRTIHSTEVKAGDMPDIKRKIKGWYNSAAKMIDAEDAAKLEKLIDAVPDTMNMLHCDYHTNNVMRQGGETLLIDMDTLSHGHPIFELANVYITQVGFAIEEPSIVENFLGMPVETAKLVWEKFLPIYLQSSDAEYITATENKIKILAYTRYIHHFVKRLGTEAPRAVSAAEAAGSIIHELLKTVDTLEF